MDNTSFKRQKTALDIKREIKIEINHDSVINDIERYSTEQEDISSEATSCDEVIEIKNEVEDSEKKSKKHQTRERKPYVCCGKTFRYKSIYKQHQILHKDNKPYVCPNCNKRYKRKSALKQHLNLRRCVKSSIPKIKRYICKKCGKTFIKKTHIKKHMASHANKRSYACKKCSKAYKLPQHLTRHMATAHSNQMHICNNCGECCRSSDSLRRHQKIHSNEVIVCDKCGFATKRKETLEQHIISVHINPKYKPTCEECRKEFRKLTNLQKHQFKELCRYKIKKEEFSSSEEN